MAVPGYIASAVVVNEAGEVLLAKRSDNEAPPLPRRR